MHAKISNNLAKLIRLYKSEGGAYAIESRKLKNGQLTDFHQWADNRPCKGAFLVRAGAESAIWIVIVDWKLSDNYYLAVFQESKAVPLAEIHHCIEDHNEYTLRWKYSPTKRDGKNSERRAYFEEAFNSKEVFISLPSSTSEMEDFFSELFDLVASRQKADALDSIRPPSREGFPEGKLKERLHRSRERNPEIIREAKQLALQRDGCLKCACCQFDFEETYGAHGKGFIEGHHTKPVSTLHVDGEITRVEDIVLVCANCHRMLHRRRPWLELGNLTELLSDG